MLNILFVLVTTTSMLKGRVASKSLVMSVSQNCIVYCV